MFHLIDDVVHDNWETQQKTKSLFLCADLLPVSGGRIEMDLIISTFQCGVRL